ncbi:hypothetical protein [Radiobacillus sp. PE A8.2]|uniref:hypothetical protein n=1 Tax=Radiobacillus sp. PE A8.2 TaxID=3380349 RepID=UPI00388F658C
MLTVLRNKKVLIYLVSLLAIISANYALYHTRILSPMPTHIALASIIDMMLIIPLLTYFFVIRNKFSWKTMALVMLAGYAVANFVIPSQYLQQYAFLPYFVVITEGLFILLELYILYKIITKLPRLINTFRTAQHDSSYFKLNLQKTVSNTFEGKLAALFVTELSLFYYALFAWRKKASTSEGEMFSYHKNTSCMAVYVMLIHAMIIETAAFHYFLHQWNEYIAIVLLVANLYGILFLVAEIQATRLTPYLLTNNALHLYVGFSQGITIPLEEIKLFRPYMGPAELTKHERKHVFVAVAKDLELEPQKAQFEIILRNPLQLQLLYGFKKEVNRVLLNVDQSATFANSLESKLK